MLKGVLEYHLKSVLRVIIFFFQILLNLILNASMNMYRVTSSYQINTKFLFSNLSLQQARKQKRAKKTKATTQTNILYKKKPNNKL